MSDELRCPHCGCNAWTVVQADRLLGILSSAGSSVRATCTRVVYRCDYCRREWTVSSNWKAEPLDVDEPVPHAQQPCPACNSTKTTVRSTRGRTRYHRCKACGITFRSIEGWG